MAPKKKKPQPHNAFYFFMLEHQRVSERRGVRYPNGLRDVSVAVASQWASMGPQAREPYEIMAQREKGRHGERYTTQGETFAEVDRREQEKLDKLHKISAAIKNFLISQGRNTGLPTAPIYFLHMNYYCQRESEFYPAELALSKFTIKDGIDQSKVMHEFIDLGSLPLGLANKAQIHAQDTTLIPLPPLPTYLNAEQDAVRLLNKIMEYVKEDVEDKRAPPFYTLEGLIASAESMLNSLSYKNGFDESIFRVYPLEELFYEMKNFTLKPQHQRLVINGNVDNGFPFKSVGDEILRDDKYSYRAGIACKFHEEQDREQHCSRSFIIRWAWHFANHMCANLDIQMRLHFHCPGDTDLSELVFPMARPICDTTQVHDEAVGGCPDAGAWQPEPSSSEHVEDNPWQTVNGHHRAARSAKTDDIQPLRKKNTQSKALALNELPDAGPRGAFFDPADFPPVVGVGRGSTRRHMGIRAEIPAELGLGARMQNMNINDHDEDAYEDYD